MRILLVFCLVIAISNGGIVRRSPKDVPSLREITSDLSILSRIVSGVALQNALIEKSLPVDELVSDLLKVQTSSISQDLKTLDLKAVGEDLESLETLKTGAGELKIMNQKPIKRLLSRVSKYFKDLEDLKTGSDSKTTETFINRAEAITGKKLDLKLIEDSKIGDIVKNLELVINGAEPGDADQAAKDTFIKALISLQDNINQDLITFISELKDFKNSPTFKALNDYLPTVDSLGSLKILKEYAKGFKDNGFSIVFNQYKGLSGELPKLEKIQNDQVLLENLKTSLEGVKKVLKEFKAPTPLKNPKILISIDDINRAFVDIKGPWFHRVISEGKGPTALQNSTQILEAFSTKMNSLEKGFEDLRAVSVKAFGNVLTRLDNLGKGLEKWKTVIDLKTSVENSANCLQSLAKLPRSTTINDYDSIVSFSNALATKLKEAFPILDEVVAHPALASTTVLDAVKAAITTPVTFGMAKSDLWPMIVAIRGVADVGNALGQLKEVSDKIQKVKDLISRDLTAQKDFSVVTKMSEILKDTQLIPVIQCLKDMNFDPKPVNNLFKIGKDIRGIGATETSELKNVAQKLQKFSDDYQKIDKSTRRRHRRNLQNPLLKLQNSMKLSQDLTSGVVFLDELTRIMDQKEEIQKAIGFDKAVDQAIWNMIPPMHGFWNQNSKKLLADAIKEIEDFEAVVTSSNKNALPDIYRVLENATGLQGIPGFKAELFENPISVDLEASKDPILKDAAPVFKKLAPLKLDFASNKKILQSAHATLKPIRDFFDNLFGIDRSPPTTMAPGSDPNDPDGKNGTSGAQASAQGGLEKKKDDSMFLYICAAAGGVVVVIILIVMIVCCVKRKNQRAKLSKPETWRHLRFLPEGKLVKADDSEYTAMHLAVKKNKLEEVKRRVKNGAFINVWSTGKMIETPLHTAVANGKPEMVEFLIRNGADMKALDSNYDSPKDKAKGKPGVLKVIKKYEKKVFRQKLPQILPANKYKLFIDKSISGLKDFCKNFKSNIVEKLESATHVVVKTGKEGVLDLDSDEGLNYLNVIFSKRILMRSDWIKASAKNRKAFQDDWEHRVTKLKFKGKTYKSVDEIQEAFQKMKVGYLTNATVHFNQGTFATVDWGSLKETAQNLGATLVDEFPVMQGMLPEHHPYYRDDLGHIFVVYKQENAGELEAQYPYLRTEKSYTFLEHDEFIALLLEYKITSKKMKSKGDKSKESKSKSMSKESGSEGSKENPENPSKEPVAEAGAETGTPAAGGSQDNANPSAEDSNGASGAPAAPGFDAPGASGGAPDPFAPPAGGVPVGADPWVNP